jgi:hypothetical protein
MIKILIILPLVGVVYLCFVVHDYIKTRAYYARLIDNEYIYSFSPTDNTVLERAQKASWWISHVGNEIGVQVQVIMFRDSKHVLETWEDYELRVNEEIKASTKKWYKKIVLKYGQDYFNREVLGQRGVVYPGEKKIIRSIYELIKA